MAEVLAPKSEIKPKGAIIKGDKNHNRINANTKKKKDATSASVKTEGKESEEMEKTENNKLLKNSEADAKEEEEVDCPPCHLLYNIPSPRQPFLEAAANQNVARHDNNNDMLSNLPPLLNRKVKVKIFPRIREPNINEETPEQTALRRLRSRLKPLIGQPMYRSAVCLSDLDLLAWLTTFDLNVYLVEAKLRKLCEVRHRMGLEGILTDYKPPQALRKHYAGGLCGVDKSMRPVWYELLGKSDVNGLVKASSRRDLLRFKFYQLEWLRQEAKKSGPTGQILALVDMKGMTHNALGPAIEIWTDYINILQDYYPYLVNEIIVINQPANFTEFTLALRPFLNLKTMSKVTVLGGCNFLKYLLQRIEKHELPAFLGGYRCDHDNNPHCTQSLTWDGTVPVWMYHDNKCLTADVHPLTIPAGERLVKHHHVVTPGSHVLWEFLDLNQPIVLSVYSNRVADGCCLLRRQKLEMTSQASSTNQMAGIVSKGAGWLLAVFDNCQNFASPAKGLYRVVVQYPDCVIAQHGHTLPLGDFFDMRTWISEDEGKMRKRKHAHELRSLWKEDLPPFA